MNKPVISVIITNANESPALLEAAKQLKRMGTTYELIPSNDIQEALDSAKGNYICILEPNSHISPNFFKENLGMFLNQENYRKLAMVSPAVKHNGLHDTYGYHYDGEFLMPNIKVQSTQPYCIQVGLIQGSVIRRSAISNFKWQNKDSKSFSETIFSSENILNSENLALDLWQNGLRCMINPDTSYLSPTVLASYHSDYVQTDFEPVKLIWKREMII